MADTKVPGTPKAEEEGDKPKPRGLPHHIVANHMRTRLEVSLDRREALEVVDDVELPHVLPPSIQDLRIRVPRVVPVSEEDVVQAFEAMRVEKAYLRDRGKAPAEAGDIVIVDVVAYDHGLVVPGTARTRAKIRLTTTYELPDLAAGLVGTAAGEGRNVSVAVPPNHPNRRMAGRVVAFAASVKQVLQCTLPAPADPAFLQLLGLGATLEDTLAAVAKKLEAQRIEDHVRAIRRELYNALLSRTPQFVISPELVDGRIRDIWRAEERPALEAWGLSNDELAEALLRWIDDGTYAREVAMELAYGMVLDAIGDAAQIFPTREDMEGVLEEAARDAGVPRETLGEALDLPQRLLATLYQLIRHRKVTEWVLAQTEVEIFDPDAPADEPDSPA